MADKETTAQVLQQIVSDTMAAGVPDASENFTKAWNAAQADADALEQDIMSKAGEAASVLRGSGAQSKKTEADESAEADEATEQDDSAEAGSDAGEPSEDSQSPDEKTKEADSAESKSNEDADKEPDKEPKGKPTAKEWAALRAAKRKQNQELSQQKQQFQQAVQQKIAELQQVEANLKQQVTASALKELRERGDYDGIAAALGSKDWEELVGDAVKVMHSPGYREVLALRRKDREREAETQRQQQEAEARNRQAQAQAAEQDRQRQVQQHISEMNEELQQSDNRAIAHLAKNDPKFVQLVFQIRQSEWDGYETIPVEEAGAKALEVVRDHYRGLAKIFGDQTAVEESEGASQPDQRGSKTAVKPSKQIPRNKVREAKKPEKELTDAEWNALAKRELEKAAAEERARA